MLPLRKTVCRIPTLSRTIRASCRQNLPSVGSSRNYSDADTKTATPVKDEAQKVDAKSSDEVKIKKKTQAELDAEVMAKLAGLDGDGGEAGIEYEDGKPTSMKRSVKNNMFRYI